MDRILASKLFMFFAIGLAIAYALLHFNELRSEYNALVSYILP
ncbi:MAG: hypothetical protein ACREQH_04980 [Candidatus Binatus sp.]